MKQELTSYVDLLFAGAADAEDMKQEILQNTLERYDDLIAQGKSPQAAYRLAITGIGDINEILGEPNTPAPAASKSSPPQTAEEKKKMRAVAIGLYICCVIPVIALGNVGNGIIGVCLMFLMVAAATVLIILSSDKNAESKSAEPPKKKRKTLSDLMGAISLALFFIVSFATGAWHITWLIFPIVGAIEGIINAVLDLVEGRKDEN